LIAARFSRNKYARFDFKPALDQGGRWDLSEDPLDHMRQRIDMCRRLARSINDAEAAKILLEMANQGELDLNRLLAERESRDENRPEASG
jgi:hypothetical protein